MESVDEKRKSFVYGVTVVTVEATRVKKNIFGWELNSLWSKSMIEIIHYLVNWSKGHFQSPLVLSENDHIT